MNWAERDVVVIWDQTEREKRPEAGESKKKKQVSREEDKGRLDNFNNKSKNECGLEKMGCQFHSP